MSELRAMIFRKPDGTTYAYNCDIADPELGQSIAATEGVEFVGICATERSALVLNTLYQVRQMQRGLQIQYCLADIGHFMPSNYAQATGPHCSNFVFRIQVPTAVKGVTADIPMTLSNGRSHTLWNRLTDHYIKPVLVDKKIFLASVTRSAKTQAGPSSFRRDIDSG